MLTLGACTHDIVMVPVPGPPGVSGGGGANPEEFLFSVPNSVWTMNHSLGRRPACVTLYDSAGNLFLSDVIANNTTQVTVHHSQPIAGRAELL